MRKLICICCPIGCEITVENDGGKITKVSGNTCKRGEEYAVSECTNPQRTVTTTIMSENGIPVPVKTDKPIPKDKIFECMKLINEKTVKRPVKAGEVAIYDVFGSNIIVTAERG